MLHFKQPCVSAVNRIASRPFRDKNNNNNKSDSFFQLNFNVFINVDNRERARARDKHQRIPISLEEKHKKFIAAVRKREMLAATIKGENERQRKKTHTTFPP